MPSIKRTIQKEFLSVKAITGILFFSIIYFCLSILLLNYKLLAQLFTIDYSFFYSLKILFYLLLGSWTSMSAINFFLLVANALLVGINLLLSIKTIHYLQHAGKVKVSLGGATLLGLATTGCTSCGFSLVSILGLSATFSSLPFHGIEIHIIALILLTISCLYMIFQLHQTKYCKMPRKKR